MKKRRRRLFITLVFALPIILIGSVELWARSVSERHDYKFFAAFHDIDGPDTGTEVSKLRWSYSSLTMGDFNGKYINVHDGERLTIGVPDTAQYDLYLLGSSVVFDPYMDDAHTMASQLQALLPAYRVHNLGVIGTNVTISLARLKTVKLHPGDLVIFDTGIREIEDVEESIIGQFKPVECNDTNSFVFFWYSTQKLVCNWLSARAIEPMQNPATYRQDVESELTHYKHALDGAKAYTDSAHARFINVLQPYLFTVPLSEREQILTTWDPDSIGLPVLYTQVYPQFRNARPDFTVDLSRIFDATRRGGIEVFVDATHYNNQGNHLMAMALAAWINDHMRNSQITLTM